MKIFGKLIKIVFILAMVTGASFASEGGYNFDDQEHDTEATVARLGFASPTKLIFTKEAVDTLLDSRFDPRRGRNPETRDRKTFLLQTVKGASFMPGSAKETSETEPQTFLDCLHTALTRASAIEVDTGSSYITFTKSSWMDSAHQEYAFIQAVSGKAFWSAIYIILHPDQAAALETCPPHDSTGIMPRYSATFIPSSYYNFDDQDNDTLDTVATLGFVNPTKFSFTKNAVEVILDGRFDPCRGRDPETRRKKTFLLRTVEGAFFNPFTAVRDIYEIGRLFFFQRLYTALEKNEGVIEVNLLPTFKGIMYPSEYIEDLYPIYNQVERGSSSAFWVAIENILHQAPAHEACSSHASTSISTVTSSATAYSSEKKF